MKIPSDLVSPDLSSPSPELRGYPAPWIKKGGLVLACAKCQRKLKGDLSKLRKPLKKLSKARGGKLLVLNVPCLKICPKGAVVVCTQQQLARGTFSLVRSKEELEPLVEAALSGPAQQTDEGGNAV